MILTTTHLSCGYEGREIVKDLSIKLPQGGYLCVVGENGAGKSTLIKTIVGLLPPISGEIAFSSSTGIGYLPQQKAIQKDFPASVKEIVLSGTISNKRFFPFYTRKDIDMATSAMKKMELLDIASKSFQELSGGQQQRVLLARALCSGKKILVLDEPVAGLDPKATFEMYEILKRINKEDNVTIVMVSHDVCCAVAQATHVLHLGHHTRFYGTVEEYKQGDLGKSFLVAAGLLHHLEHQEKA